MRRQVTSSAGRWRSAGKRSLSARGVMMAQRAPIKARPMSSSLTPRLLTTRR